MSTPLIVADESGIVVIRAREIEDILTRAEGRCRNEAALMNELRADCTTRNCSALDEKSVGK